MKGYSKIKGNNNSFIQRSKSNKEFLFLDTDFDLLSSKPTNKKTHLVHEQESSIPDQVINNNKKDGFFLEKSEVVDEYDGRDHHHHQSLKQENGEKTGGILRRNFSISSANSSYQKNNNKGNNYLERQSSTRAIQEAVKRAFSIKRCSSVNSDRYCRIYDQTNMGFDQNDGNVYVNYDHQDDDFERNGSLDTRYVSMMKNSDHHHNHGKRHVGSKVVRACKHLFSR